MACGLEKLQGGGGEEGRGGVGHWVQGGFGAGGVWVGEQAKGPGGGASIMRTVRQLEKRGPGRPL